MKKIIAAAVTACCLLSPPALANTYVAASAGIGLSNRWVETGYTDDLDSGLVLNGAAGYDFGQTRLEAAVGYQGHDFKNSTTSISLITVLANGYYDFEAGPNISPYVMAGAGIGIFDVSWDTADATAFMWQIGAGLGFPLEKNLTLDIGYRFLKAEGLDCPTEGTNVTWSSHNLVAGIRYGF